MREMTQELTTEIERTDIDEWTGDVPDTIEFDRVYAWEDESIVGERWMPNGDVVEVRFERDGSVKADRITNPSGVDPAHEVLWERDGRAERELGMLVESLSPAEALDFWVVEIRGETASSWSDRRGTSHQAVSENVRKAREKLGQ